MPDIIENDTLYISLDYATAIHKCACGCGSEVVTPFSPNDWNMIFDGESISLHPSIGNWNFNCRSHYWIRNNEIVWAPKWDENKTNSRQNKGKKKKKIFNFSPKTLINKFNKKQEDNNGRL